MPHHLLGQITDDKVMLYYHIILFMKEQEADAIANAPR